MNDQTLEVLRALAQQRQVTPPIAQAITHAVALAFGISAVEIIGRDRHKSISEARAVSCYVARRCTRMSFEEIGRALNMHHTSVMAALKRVERLRERDAWTDSACAVLLEQFGEIQETREQ